MIEALRKLENIRHVVLDMDGTIYMGSHLFPQTLPFLEELGRLSIGYSFLTNNPSKSRRDYVVHLERLGIIVRPEKIFSTIQATVHHLNETLPEAKRIFLLGTGSMADELIEAGYEMGSDHPDDDPDAVVVAFDPGMDYPKLCRTAWWISKGKPYIATNGDRVCPTNERTILPDCGAICAALEAATGRAPDVILGKPDPSLLDCICEKHALQRSEVIMVGDRLYTDLAMAHRAGVAGALVLTGEATAEDAVAAFPSPDWIVADVGELGRLLRKVHAPVQGQSQ